MDSLIVLSIQRKTLRLLKLRKSSELCDSDEFISVPAGNLVAVAQREVMRDPAIYDMPDTFNAYRFLQYGPQKDAEDKVRTKYTDVK
jgi:cytochrome P450